MCHTFSGKLPGIQLQVAGQDTSQTIPTGVMLLEPPSSDEHHIVLPYKMKMVKGTTAIIYNYQIFFLKAIIFFLFSKNPLNWSKMAVKIFIMLQKFSILKMLFFWNFPMFCCMLEWFLKDHVTLKTGVLTESLKFSFSFTIKCMKTAIINYFIQYYCFNVFMIRQMQAWWAQETSFKHTHKKNVLLNAM